MIFSELRYPIIQAPMAGGVSTAKLAIEVSKNGGLGFLAAGYKTSDVLENEIKACIEANVLYGVNLFVPSNEMLDEAALQAYKKQLEKDFSISLPVKEWSDDEWFEKLALVEKYKVPFVSFTFGCPEKQIIKRLHKVGCQIIVTVTNIEEARIAYERSANAICVQGINAGGHRGTFQNTNSLNFEPLHELIMKVKNAVNMPIIAAGGIMTGQQIKVLLIAGASAVQLGTAFICCNESGANEVYKRALLEGHFHKTELTKTFTGRLARGLSNEFMKKYELKAPNVYPALHYMTQPIRKQALENEDPQTMSLWAGTGFKMIRALPVKDLLGKLVEEANL